MNKRGNFIKFTWRGEKLGDVLYDIIEGIWQLTSFDMPLSYDIMVSKRIITVSTYATDYRCQISDSEIREKYGNRVGKRSSDFVRSIPASLFEKQYLDEFDGIQVNTNWGTSVDYTVHPDKILDKVMKILNSLNVTDQFVFYMDCEGNISISYFDKF